MNAYSEESWRQAAPYGSTTGPTKSDVSSSEFAITVAQLAFLIMIPWAIFAGLSWTLISLELYLHPRLRIIVVASGFALVILMGVAALLARGRWLRKGGKLAASEPRYLRDFTWWGALAILSVGALLAGLVMGDVISSQYMNAYYDTTTLDYYDNVDPARVQGQQLLDAGRIIFSRGSHLNLNLSMGFKNSVTYCVAPIVSIGPLPVAFDFWAAGKDCCSETGANFSCGAGGSEARGGIRQMSQDDTENWKLALQEAQAAHHIETAHPLFFEWVADPVGEINSKKDSAENLYQNANFFFLVITASLVITGYSCLKLAKSA